eukprot:6415555-Amphidinium_carterae.1
MESQRMCDCKRHGSKLRGARTRNWASHWPPSHADSAQHLPILFPYEKSSRFLPFLRVSDAVVYMVSNLGDWGKTILVPLRVVGCISGKASCK